MNFALQRKHGWTILDLDNMMPFERELYVVMLKQDLEEEYRRQQERKIRGNG